ncbi:MAG: hypothetical protein JNN07_01265 [Verrucomicrobiales bacterium]|nr:hypothetical protein [Verrucomicrobiales bacterium]
MNSTQAERAFSRTDLLVVVLAGAAMAAALYPWLVRTRVQRARLACIDNVKQVSLASMMWLHNYEDRFPWMVPVREGGSQGLPLVSDHFRALSNYLESPRVVSCPGLVRHRPPADSWSRFQERNAGYAVMTDARVIMESSAVSPLSDQVMMCDLDLEGGKPGFCARTRLSVMVFDLSGAMGWGSGIRWSETNHVDQGSLTMVDGGVAMLDNEGLRRRLLSMPQQSAILHLLLPQ